MRWLLALRWVAVIRDWWTRREETEAGLGNRKRPDGRGWCLAPSRSGGFEYRYLRFPWCRPAWPRLSTWLFHHVIFGHILGGHPFESRTYMLLMRVGFIDAESEGGATFWRWRFWRSVHRAYWIAEPLVREIEQTRVGDAFERGYVMGALGREVTEEMVSSMLPWPKKSADEVGALRNRIVASVDAWRRAERKESA